MRYINLHFTYLLTYLPYSSEIMGWYQCCHNVAEIVNPVFRCREAVSTSYKYHIILNLSGNGIYSQEFGEVSRSS